MSEQEKHMTEAKPESSETQAAVQPSPAMPESTQSKATAASAPASPPATAKSGGKAIAWLAILLSLGALGGSGYTWYQTQVQGVQKESRLAIGVSDIGNQVTRLGDSVARLQKEQADVVSQAQLGNRLLEMQSKVDTAVRDLRDDQTTALAAVDEFRVELSRGVDQFTIEEVSQLLRLANNSVLFGKDIEAASHALTLADAQLKGLKDPRYALVRTQINAELAKLKSVSAPDVEALSAQLNTIAEQVPNLPLQNEPREHEFAQAEVTESAEQSVTFRGEMVKIWRDLLGSISIQRVDQPPKPLLVPEQRFFLNENIALALSKAELAMLQGQTTIYQQSLASASAWLNEYFDRNNADVKAVIAQIDGLANESIVTELPDITGSYQLLQETVGGQ